MYEDIPEEIVHEKNIEFALKGIHSNSISGTIASLKKLIESYFKIFRRTLCG